MNIDTIKLQEQYDYQESIKGQPPIKNSETNQEIQNRQEDVLDKQKVDILA